MNLSLTVNYFKRKNFLSVLSECNNPREKNIYNTFTTDYVNNLYYNLYVLQPVYNRYFSMRFLFHFYCIAFFLSFKSPSHGVCIYDNSK